LDEHAQADEAKIQAIVSNETNKPVKLAQSLR
jgi:hypothetical protein